MLDMHHRAPTALTMTMLISSVLSALNHYIPSRGHVDSSVGVLDGIVA